MRLNKKNKIIALLDTIEEGFNYAANTDKLNSEKMIADCFNALDSISNSVEEVIIHDEIQKILEKNDQIINLLMNNENIGDLIYSIKKDCIN